MKEISHKDERMLNDAVLSRSNVLWKCVHLLSFFISLFIGVVLVKQLMLKERATFCHFKVQTMFKRVVSFYLSQFLGYTQQKS